MGLLYDLKSKYDIDLLPGGGIDLPAASTKIGGSVIATWLATQLAGVVALGAGSTVGGTALRGDGGIEVALADADTAGGVLAWQNPESVAIVLTEVTIDVTTKSTEACTVDVGIAADATTSDDALVDGQDVGAAAVLFTGNANLPLKVDAKGGTNDYVTISKASGAAAGLAGTAYIRYMKVPAA